MKWLALGLTLLIFWFTQDKALTLQVVKETEQVLGLSQPFDANQVTRIIDGDTIELANGQVVRYIGIDTPETKHPDKGRECFGQEAHIFNQSLVLNKVVRLEKDVSETDRYGRLLRYVYVDDVMVNEQLVAEGYAMAASFPPDVKYQEKFQQLQEQARITDKGLWSACSRQ